MTAFRTLHRRPTKIDAPDPELPRIGGSRLCNGREPDVHARRSENRPPMSSMRTELSLVQAFCSAMLVNLP
ncbi:MAG: hypothetical protein ABIR04_00190 [Cypionkella sp.]